MGKAIVRIVSIGSWRNLTILNQIAEILKILEKKPLKNLQDFAEKIISYMNGIIFCHHNIASKYKYKINAGFTVFSFWKLYYMAGDISEVKEH